MLKLIYALPILAIAGCTASYQIQSTSGTKVARLDPARGVYVTVPRDGSYGSTTYSGSGQIAAQGVAAAFSKYASRVQVAEKPSETKEAMASAKSLGASYLVVPAIAHWEQRATEWSGRPSRMAIRVSVIDASSGEQITSSLVEGRSRIVSWTSTSPESLLKDPLNEYVRGLY